MRSLFPGLRLSAFWIFCVALRLQAQELTFYKGEMHTPDIHESSFAWQIDYRQNVFRYLAASVAYINEGHVTGHHRDGTAWQFWGRLPLFHDRVTLAGGAGVYYFYDTQFGPAGNSLNVHGTAPVYSLSASTYLYNRWYCSLLLNHIEPANNIKVDTAALGIGFWFGQDKRPFKGTLGSTPEEKHYVSESEIVAYIGQGVVNTFASESSHSYAVDFRQGLFPHVDATGSFIYEGDPKIVRRNGVAAELWLVNTFYNERVTVGLGAGPYLYIDRKHPAPGNPKNPAAIAPLVSLTMSARLTEAWIVRLMFHRVTTDYNRDSDIFLLGLGYRWSH